MSGLQVFLHTNLCVIQANLLEILVNSYKSNLPAVLPFIRSVFCGLSNSPGSLVICIRSDWLQQITSDLCKKSIVQPNYVCGCVGLNTLTNGSGY